MNKSNKVRATYRRIVNSIYAVRDQEKKTMSKDKSMTFALNRLSKSESSRIRKALRTARMEQSSQLPDWNAEGAACLLP